MRGFLDDIGGFPDYSGCMRLGAITHEAVADHMWEQYSNKRSPPTPPPTNELPQDKQCREHGGDVWTDEGI
jgi:hypothetical protein